MNRALAGVGLVVIITMVTSPSSGAGRKDSPRSVAPRPLLTVLDTDVDSVEQGDRLGILIAIDPTTPKDIEARLADLTVTLRFPDDPPLRGMDLEFTGHGLLGSPAGFGDVFTYATAKGHRPSVTRAVLYAKLPYDEHEADDTSAELMVIDDARHLIARDGHIRVVTRHPIAGRPDLQRTVIAAVILVALLTAVAIARFNRLDAV